MATADTVPALSLPLRTLFSDALAYAGTQLGLLVDREIAFDVVGVDCVRLDDLPMRIEGGPERPVTAVYLAFHGGIDGHVVLSFTPEAAAYLAQVALMLDAAPDTDALRYLADSMIGEVGNVAATAFLNAVADAAHCSIQPSPPCVVHDMFGALLESVVVAMADDQAYGIMLRTVFTLDGDPFGGDLIMLPSLTSCALLERVLAH